MIKRGAEPFNNFIAIPGDLVAEDEDLEPAASSVLKSLTGLENIFMEQLYTFGKVDRHPQGRIITVAYYTLVNIEEVTPTPASFAADIQWLSFDDIPQLAFDHNEILAKAIERLKWRAHTKPIGLELLPVKFTLSQLRKLYEGILEKTLDKRNFRRKIIKMDILIALDEKQKNVAHKAARFYKFDVEKYHNLSKEGYIFSM